MEFWKKPVKVEAAKWTGKNFEEISKLLAMDENGTIKRDFYETTKDGMIVSADDSVYYDSENVRLFCSVMGADEGTGLRDGGVAMVPIGWYVVRDGTGALFGEKASCIYIYEPKQFELLFKKHCNE
nr:MAG TPA: hypothetical protein [Caudoviricetes sp.]